MCKTLKIPQKPPMQPKVAARLLVR